MKITALHRLDDGSPNDAIKFVPPNRSIKMDKRHIKAPLPLMTLTFGVESKGGDRMTSNMYFM